jgi:LysR family glycine cleavage system transcriptional activator
MRRPIPATHTLLCFEAAARHESYTRAAQELALTQSAVSRQIAALEQQVGQTLFQRTRHGVALTERGAAYARQVRQRLQALERDTLELMSGPEDGRAITLAAVPTFATRWLVPRLPALAREHPGIVVHIETRTRPFLFADTGFDAALYAGTAAQVANWAGTRAELLLHEALVPVCAPALLPGGRIVAPQDVAGMPLLQQSTRPLAWQQWFDQAQVHAPLALAGPRYEVFSMTAAAAISGMGVALMPRLLVEDELARGLLVEACTSVAHGDRAYYLVWPDRQQDSAALQRFRSWLLAQARSGPPHRPQG